MSGKKIKKIAITGAAGRVAYALLPQLARGCLFGAHTKIQMSLLDVKGAAQALTGVAMECEDCAFDAVSEIKTTGDPAVAFEGADLIIMAGGAARQAGMKRVDLLKQNAKIFIQQAKELDRRAKKNVKILVVANPCNTNAYIMTSIVQRISKKNIFALTRLDQNRATWQLARKAKTTTDQIKSLAIWGNHSLTMFPDFYHATISGKPLLKVLPDEKWLKEEFLKIVQTRGAAVIQQRGTSSAASAASAVVDTLRDIHEPTAQRDWFSLGVASQGNYGIQKGLIFSFPVCSDGKMLQIVEGIKHNDFAMKKIEQTYQELLEEKKVINQLI